MTLKRQLLALSIGFFSIMSSRAQASTCDKIQVQIATTPVIEQSPARLSRAVERSRSANKEYDVFLFGDSLADGWIPFQQRDFSGSRTYNFGIGGDKTQETLWRLNSLLPPMPEPKNAILLIGTNNLTDISALPCGIAAGITENVSALLTKWQSAKIFVVPILPRGPSFSFRSTDRLEILTLLTERFRDDLRVSIVSIDEKALTCGGTVPCQYFLPDNTHLSGEGYVKLREFIEQASLVKFGSGL